MLMDGQTAAKKHGHARNPAHATPILGVLILCCVGAMAQQPGGIAIADDAIPGRHAPKKMDRREPSATPGAATSLPKLRNAHELLEKYFSAKSSPERA